VHKGHDVPILSASAKENNADKVARMVMSGHGMKPTASKLFRRCLRRSAHAEISTIKTDKMPNIVNPLCTASPLRYGGLNWLTPA
jgi:hypothetical protein